MRKQEYIHVHGLLVELVQYLSEDGVISSERISEYNALDTRPLSVHASKEEHHAAVTVLATTIETELEQTPNHSPGMTVT